MQTYLNSFSCVINCGYFYTITALHNTVKEKKETKTKLSQFKLIYECLDPSFPFSDPSVPLRS